MAEEKKIFTKPLPQILDEMDARIKELEKIVLHIEAEKE